MRSILPFKAAIARSFAVATLDLFGRFRTLCRIEIGSPMSSFMTVLAGGIKNGRLTLGRKLRKR